MAGSYHRSRPNKITGANSRSTSPLDAGRQFESASCAPPLLSAAVAQFWHSTPAVITVSANSARRHTRFRATAAAGLTLVWLALSLCPALGAPVDEMVAAEMKNHGIPGLSLAIIDKERSFGRGATALPTRAGPPRSPPTRCFKRLR